MAQGTEITKMLGYYNDTGLPMLKGNKLRLGIKLSPREIKQRTETRKRNGWLKKPFSHRGENHWNWKGGISSKLLNLKCKERDDWTCQSCLLREPEIMEVDHVKSKARFPELQHDLNNLITLCPNCHKRKTLKENDLHPQLTA